MRQNKDGMWAIFFLAPATLLLVIFVVGPIISSLILTFFEWDLLTPPEWVGFENFRTMFQDGDFYKALGNTFYFIAGYVPAVMILGLLVATVMNHNIPLRSGLRIAFFLPVVSSWVAVALLWRWIFNPKFGLINFIIGLLGITGPSWLFDPNWAMPAIIITSVWKDIGFAMMIFLAGLQDIPKQFYEAAAIDGAGTQRKFFSITIPILSPVIFFLLTILMINSFQVFDQVWVMTGGGPAGATSVMVQQIYLNAARYGEMGYAAALSWILFCFIFLVTFLQMQFQKRWVHYAS